MRFHPIQHENVIQSFPSLVLFPFERESQKNRVLANMTYTRIQHPTASPALFLCLLACFFVFFGSVVSQSCPLNVELQWIANRNERLSLFITHFILNSIQVNIPKSSIRAAPKPQ